MTTIFLRIFIIYFTVIFSVRLMGKRQIGELQLSELVTTIFISELAAEPITENNTPILYGVIPILLLLGTEVILSFLSSRFKPIQKAFDNSPTLLIRQGVLLQKELKRSRMTCEELISQLRLKGFDSISKVNYAILEPNGQISVLPKAEESPPAAKDLNVTVTDEGMAHIIISDGKENPKAIEDAGRDSSWIRAKLKEKNITAIDDVFLMTLDDAENILIIEKEKN